MVDTEDESGWTTDKECVTDDESDVEALDFVGGTGPRQFIRPNGPDGCILSVKVPDGLHFYGMDSDGDPIFRRLELRVADFSTHAVQSASSGRPESHPGGRGPAIPHLAGPRRLSL